MYRNLVKYIKKYFTVWWIPIVFYIFPILGFQIGISQKSNNIIDNSLTVFLINVVGNITSVVVHIVFAIRKKWYYVLFVIPQIIISVILFFFVSIFFTYGRPDYYGADKTIPKNAECEQPVENAVKENELNSFSLQGGYGYYSYYVNFQPIEKGYLYIKAYEITSNERLSEEYLNESSKIMIENLNQKFYSGGFTIYKGNMGFKYCARIELWFKPDKGKEYKVNQKNYIVEGKD